MIGLSNGALYALIALGYTMVYGIIELINFAHGDLFMLGSVLAAILLEEKLGPDLVVARGMGLSPADAAWRSWLFCALLNVRIEKLAYRRLRKAPKLAPLITAVGVSFILQNIGIILNGSAPELACQRVAAGVDLDRLDRDPHQVPDRHRRHHPAAAADDLDRAEDQVGQGDACHGPGPGRLAADGHQRRPDIAYVFALGGALAGAAGSAVRPGQRQTRYDAGFQLGLIAFTAAVLGGIGNLTGAVIGGVLIGIIQGLNDGGLGVPGQKWSQTVVFTILILVMVFRPGGIFGKHQQEKV